MGGRNGAEEEAKRARKDEEKRQKRIRTGTRDVNTTFRQFNPAFYSGLEQSYVDYATPQLDDQREDAGEDLTYWLAGKGLLDSSVRGEKEAELGKVYELNRQKVKDDARAYGKEARGNVEDARSDLVTMLHATGDAKGAADSALSRAAVLSKPPSYSPLENAFLEFTAGLGQQAALERAYAAGSPMRPRYNTGLFGGADRSVVVR